MKIVNTNEKIEKIEKIGIILRPSTPELKEQYLQIKDIFEKYGVTVLIDSISAGMIGVMGQDFDTLCQESDVLVTIGGDGTLISVARRSYKYNKPILAISAGKLGFLTDIKPDEIDSFIQKLFNKEYRVDLRMMIEATLYKNGEEKKFISFNDLVVTRKSISKMINIETFVSDKNKDKFNNGFLNSYFADGLIISTPTGSTAYNLAANGPVVYPLTEAFVVTPICPHSLTQRPLILPVDFEISLKTPDSEGAIVIVDGQEIYEFTNSDKIVVSVAKEPMKLIHRLERNYFEVLREKLSWGEKE
jgi:NAD+ kinase